MNESLSLWLQNSLRDLGFPLPQAGPQLAEAIVQLSKEFQREERQTPWAKSAMRAAYLSYFFPLNYLRIQRVIKMLPAHFFGHYKHVIEIGSGAGSFQAAQSLFGPSYSVVEKDDIAFELHLSLADHLKLVRPRRWPISAQPDILPQTLVVLVYSFNELKSLPGWVEQAEAVFIVEPSQIVQSRALMSLRKELLKKGFYAVAPCTHQETCPLLQHTKNDFCHDRFFPQFPGWLQDLETMLPMKNRSLTLSYLVAVKHAQMSQVFAGQTRVLGDTLFEKGKVRQAICRGPDREFISVLKKQDKKFAGFEHGSLIKLPPALEKKGNELRLTNTALVPDTSSDI
jgi:hypothetical protein